ncbi:MaoC family dehydratase N-terminal domain-containing protein [Chloroflexota bacterium]
MSKPQKVEYQQIEAGHDFPLVSYHLDALIAASYLKAVGETSSLYQNNKLIPPTAVAARAMAALSDSISLPPGTIHVSQELEFTGTVNVGDTITCHAKVARKQDRGRLHLMTIDLNVFNQNQKKVLSGKTSFVLPEPDNRRL